MTYKSADALSKPPEAYQALPEAIRHTLAPKEWAWLSDAEKAGLVQHETEPENEL